MRLRGGARFLAAAFLSPIVVSLVVAGCGGSSHHGSGSTTPGSATIGSQGGTLQSNGTTVVVPAGAVNQPTTFSIQAGTKVASGAYAEAGDAVQLLPQGLALGAPVTVTLPYDDAKITANGRTTADLVVLHRDDSTGKITVLTPTSVDTAAHTVTVQVSSFCTVQPAVPAKVDANKSTVTVSPSSATADGSSTVTVTVTVRNTSNELYPGATVVLSATGSSNTFVQPAVTNAQGVTTGTLSSTTAESKTITATAGGVAIAQQATATFSPVPSTVNTTVSNSNNWKPADSGLPFNSSAHEPGASSTGTWAYVGQSGVIATSNDAQTQFTYRTSGVTTNLNKVIYVGAVTNIAATNQNHFFAVGDGTTILSSPDGTTWTKQSLTANTALDTALGSNTTLTGIALVTNGASGSGFLICGARNNNTAGRNGTILFTTDVLDATKYVDLSFGSDVDYTDCAFGDIGGADKNLFEVVSPTGANGSSIFQKVNDDTAPSTGWSANASAAHPMSFIEFCNAGTAGANACFVAAGTNAASVFGITVTAGGQGWSNTVTASTGAFAGAYQLANATTLDATGIAFATIGGTDTAVIAGNMATGAAALTNTTFPGPAGTDWTTTGVSFKFDATHNFTGSQALLTRVSADASAPNPFTITAVRGGVLAATDGKAYTVVHYDPNVTLNAACTGTVVSAPLLVAVGNNDAVRGVPTILSSTDGLSWTQRVPTTLTSVNLNAVVQGGTRFVAVGNSALATATDGVTWTGDTTSLTHTYRAVAFGGGKFVAVGDAGWVQTSADGLTWTAATQTGNGNPNFTCIAFGAGTFVAAGNGGVILRSTDGVTWTAAASSPLGIQAIEGLVFANNSTFILVENGGNVSTSTDGSNFTALTNLTGNDLHAVAFVATPNGSGTTTKAVAAGNNGDIRVSADLGQSWSAATSGTTSGLWGATAWSTLATTFNSGTNVTTNTYTQMFVVVGNNGTILTSR